MPTIIVIRYLRMGFLAGTSTSVSASTSASTSITTQPLSSTTGASTSGTTSLISLTSQAPKLPSEIAGRTVEEAEVAKVVEGQTFLEQQLELIETHQQEANEFSTRIKKLVNRGTGPDHDMAGSRFWLN